MTATSDHRARFSSQFQGCLCLELASRWRDHWRWSVAPSQPTGTSIANLMNCLDNLTRKAGREDRARACSLFSSYLTSQCTLRHQSQRDHKLIQMPHLDPNTTSQRPDYPDGPLQGIYWGKFTRLTLPTKFYKALNIQRLNCRIICTQNHHAFEHIFQRGKK